MEHVCSVKYAVRRLGVHEMKPMSYLVELYDPHPGFAGAALPLPSAMKNAADRLNGKKMSLDEAVKELSEVAEKIGGTIEVVDKYNCIKFQLGEISHPPVHIYRLIKYK